MEIPKLGSEHGWVLTPVAPRFDTLAWLTVEISKDSDREQYLFMFLKELQTEILRSVPAIPFVPRSSGIPPERLRYFARRLSEAFDKK